MINTLSNPEREALAAFRTSTEVLNCEDVAERTGYKVTTVRNILPRLAEGGHIWRLAKGFYSFDPHPTDFFADQDYVLAAFRDHSVVSTDYVRGKTGLPRDLVFKICNRLAEKGLIYKIRPGVYSCRPAPAAQERAPVDRPTLDRVVTRYLAPRSGTSLRLLSLYLNRPQKEIRAVLDSMVERGLVAPPRGNYYALPAQKGGVEDPFAA